MKDLHCNMSIIVQHILSFARILKLNYHFVSKTMDTQEPGDCDKNRKHYYLHRKLPRLVHL